MRDLNLTLLQTDLHWQNPAANRALFSELIAANAPHSDLIVLPEMFTTGFTMDAGNNWEAADGETVRWMQTTAAAQNTALCGSLVIHSDGHYYNRLIWAAPGQPPLSYDKRHLFRLAGEAQHYTAGQKRLIVQLGDWRICPLICYDLRFPVWSRGNNDFDLLLYVANWPKARRSAWLGLLPARSIENLCYVAGVNRIGTDGNGVEYSGDSLIADHLGTVIAAGNDSAGAIQTTLSLDKLMRYRDKFPAWKDADKFTLTDNDR